MNKKFRNKYKSKFKKRDYIGIYNDLMHESNLKAIKASIKANLSAIDKSSLLALIIPIFSAYVTIMNEIYTKIHISNGIIVACLIIVMISIILLILYSLYWCQYYTFLLSIIEDIEKNKLIKLKMTRSLYKIQITKFKTK